MGGLEVNGQATVFNIQRFSTEDGPGIRTTVFFKGCPLHCPWCHNPEGIDRKPTVVWWKSQCLRCQDCIAACPAVALTLEQELIRWRASSCTGCGRCAEACPTQALELIGTTVTVDKVVDSVVKDRSFYETSGGGVTLSGGEPCMQHKFLSALLPRLHQAGIKTALDTCGATDPKILKELLAWVDLILFDLKLADPHEHVRVTGIELEVVLAALTTVAESGKPLWIRTPVIPGYTADRENVRDIAKLILLLAPNVLRYELLAFSNLCAGKYEAMNLDFPLRHTQLLTPQNMEQLVTVARSVGDLPVMWSGPTRDP